MFLNLGKKRVVDQFIPGDGITIQWFEENFARYVGPDIEWTYCTHMDNGKEGFLCKVYETIGPDVILSMRIDCHEETQRLKDQARRAYFERLEDTWRRGELEKRQLEEARRQHHARARQQEENWRLHGGPGLDIPILRLPPSYESAQRDSGYHENHRPLSGPVWSDEEECWIYNGNPPGSTRFTRSTPVTPVSPPPGGYWGTDRMSLTPVSPISCHGNNPGFLDKYQQRSSGVIAHHDRSAGVRRPRSATDMRLSSTGQMLVNMSRGSYSWI